MSRKTYNEPKKSRNVWEQLDELYGKIEEINMKLDSLQTSLDNAWKAINGNKLAIPSKSIFRTRLVSFKLSDLTVTEEVGHYFYWLDITHNFNLSYPYSIFYMIKITTLVDGYGQYHDLTNENSDYAVDTGIMNTANTVRLRIENYGTAVQRLEGHIILVGINNP